MLRELISTPFYWFERSSVLKAYCQNTTATCQSPTRPIPAKACQGKGTPKRPVRHASVRSFTGIKSCWVRSASRIQPSSWQALWYPVQWNPPFKTPHLTLPLFQVKRADHCTQPTLRVRCSWICKRQLACTPYTFSSRSRTREELPGHWNDEARLMGGGLRDSRSVHGSVEEWWGFENGVWRL